MAMQVRISARPFHWARMTIGYNPCLLGCSSIIILKIAVLVFISDNTFILFCTYV